MLTREQLQHATGETAFPMDSLEKVSMLVRFLNLIAVHPFLGRRVALKGGTALNLFVFELPRLSVDIDLNYVGAAERKTMTEERPKVDEALSQVASRMGLSVKRAPDEHAGGKWRLSYTSALGRPAIIEVDINYMLRVPLWDVAPRDSHEFLGDRAQNVNVLDPHELAAGKLAALLARGASRDLFDARELLERGSFDLDKLRLAFVVYGGINRVDWRTVSAAVVSTTVTDVKRQLLPMLRQDIRPQEDEVEQWVANLVDETRALLSVVLPFTASESRFLERLNDEGVIDAALLTRDAELQRRIDTNPGLQWKALNVRQHASKAKKR
ncbi:MAG: nucleotidyl transferase AbiEii/AbiGii toxin family protein [Polyangiaceae bacterium]